MKRHCMALVVFAVCGTAFAATLTKDNLEVVVAADAVPAVRFAADEMTNFLSCVLGAPIPLRQAPGESRVSIILGDSEWARSAGIDVQSFARDAFVIKAVGDRIYIAGRDDPKKDPKRHTEPNTTYRANILRFIRETRAAGASPVLVTLNQSLRWDKQNQRPDFFNGKVFRADREPYSAVMRELAVSEKVPCIDLAKAQQETMEKMGLEKAVKYYRVHDLKTMKLDCFHTNLAGAHLLAGLIVEGLKKTDCPLKDELKKDAPKPEK